MKGWVIIPVVYKGEELEFKAKMEEGRYGLKFRVKVEGVDVMFKADKGGRYWGRVKFPVGEGEKSNGQLASGNEQGGNSIEMELLEEIGRVIEEGVME